MAKRPLAKLPVPERYRCVMMTRTGKVCERVIAYEITREDKSTFMLCARCAVKLRDQHEAFPESFPKLRFHYLSDIKEVV